MNESPIATIASWNLSFNSTDLKSLSLPTILKFWSVNNFSLGNNYDKEIQQLDILIA